MNNGPVGRRDRLTKEKEHYTYGDRNKWPDPTVCKTCGAIFTTGRWIWKERPESAHEAVCPACLRIANHHAAGFIELKGDFYQHRKQEVMNLVRNVEALQKTNYPLERVIEIQEMDEHTLITTTGVHVARRIGEALARSYQGKFSFQYGADEKLIRVYWER